MKFSLIQSPRRCAPAAFAAVLILGLITPAFGAGSGASPAGQSALSEFRIADGATPVIGHGGRLMRFRVAVERSIATPTPAAFAASVVKILSDPRSWTYGGQWRFQRVGPGERADFTIYLATPVTRDVLCEEGYDRYTSCRNGDRVVINIDRWLHGVPNYGAPLSVYRAYVINHEVGHELGHGHVLCPGPGRPAPVMEQETLGLHGCVANSWPYPNGHYYTGPPGEYHDPIPRPKPVAGGGH